MKAKEVLKLLDIHRMTLYNYVKSGIISVIKLDNGTYDYDENSVFKLMKKDSRINVLYARVSTYKQKQDLNNQINRLKTFCKESNISYDKIYSEISSGIDLDRTQLSNLIDDVKIDKYTYLSIFRF
jgi:predicted site-specific integrase-resolvase